MLAVAAAVVAMAAVRVWTYRGPPGWQPFTGPLAAAALLTVPAAAGLSLAGVGLAVPSRAAVAYAVACVAVVAGAYGVAVLLRPLRRRLRATPRPGHPVRTALVAIPLATVIFEEVAFRGVLWGLLADRSGPHAATAVSAVLFGLWHIPPRRTRVPVVAGTVVFTAAAGVVLGELRHVTGGLLAPAALHWAANGLGVLAVAAVTAAGPRGRG